MQPLEPGLPHPDRRPFQVAREEEERGADTEADAGGPPALLDDLRQQLLLRRAHGEQDEPGRLALDEVGGVQHRLAVADEAHGRVVVPDLAQAVAPAELLHHLLGAADDGQPLVRVGDVLEKHRRQVGARYDRQLRPAQAGHQAQDAAVAQGEVGILVDRPQRLAFAPVAHDVVDIGGHDVAEGIGGAALLQVLQHGRGIDGAERHPAEARGPEPAGPALLVPGGRRQRTQAQAGHRPRPSRVCRLFSTSSIVTGFVRYSCAP